MEIWGIWFARACFYQVRLQLLLIKEVKHISLLVCIFQAAQADDMGDEGGQNENLTAVMESMGIYDTDLRARGNPNASAVNETQRLLKILLATLNKAVTQGAIPLQANHGEPSKSAGRVEPSLADQEKQNEPLSQTNYVEVRQKQVIHYFVQLLLGCGV